jgi:ribosomal protein L34E
VLGKGGPLAGVEAEREGRYNRVKRSEASKERPQEGIFSTENLQLEGSLKSSSPQDDVCI